MNKIIIWIVALFLCCPIVMAKKAGNTDSYHNQIILYNQNISKYKSSYSSNQNTKIKNKLVNAYISRAEIFEKQNQWNKATNDYRSALFYLKYTDMNNSDEQLIAKYELQLDKCYKMTGYKTTSKNRYNTANLLKSSQEYAAAGYEYSKAARDKKYRLTSIDNIGEIYRKLELADNYYTPSQKEQWQIDNVDFSKYISNVTNKINSNWNPITTDKTYNIGIAIFLDKQGNIFSVKVFQSCGNSEDDNNAVQTIYKSAPFEKLPEGYTKEYFGFKYFLGYKVSE